MTTQPFAVFDAAAGYAVFDSSLFESAPAARKVVAFVGVQFVWAPARATARLADRAHGVDQRFKHHRVVDVGGADCAGERDSVAIDQDMAL
jgi:hypothetical protein